MSPPRVVPDSSSASAPPSSGPVGTRTARIEAAVADPIGTGSPVAYPTFLRTIYNAQSRERFRRPSRRCWRARVALGSGAFLGGEERRQVAGGASQVFADGPLRARRVAADARIQDLLVLFVGPL